jgi:hypothetical protein
MSNPPPNAVVPFGPFALSLAGVQGMGHAESTTRGTTFELVAIERLTASPTSLNITDVYGDVHPG